MKDQFTYHLLYPLSKDWVLQIPYGPTAGEHLHLWDTHKQTNRRGLHKSGTTEGKAPVRFI